MLCYICVFNLLLNIGSEWKEIRKECYGFVNLEYLGAYLDPNSNRRWERLKKMGLIKFHTAREEMLLLFFIAICCLFVWKLWFWIILRKKKVRKRKCFYICMCVSDSWLLLLIPLLFPHTHIYIEKESFTTSM